MKNNFFGRLKDRFLEEAEELVYSLAVIVSHLLVAAAVLASVWCIEREIHIFWGESEPKALGFIPMRMIIDTVDAGILIVFLGGGVWRAVKSFGGERDGKRDD